MQAHAADRKPTIIIASSSHSRPVTGSTKASRSRALPSTELLEMKKGGRLLGALRRPAGQKIPKNPRHRKICRCVKLDGEK